MTGLEKMIVRTFEEYFETLEGDEPTGLYDLFLQVTERPFLETVFRLCKRNVSRTARVLGINRATLRSRLLKYQIGE